MHADLTARITPVEDSRHPDFISQCRAVFEQGGRVSVQHHSRGAVYSRLWDNGIAASVANDGRGGWIITRRDNEKQSLPKHD